MIPEHLGPDKLTCDTQNPSFEFLFKTGDTCVEVG
jgi:hypothetical protein